MGDEEADRLTQVFLNAYGDASWSRMPEERRFRYRKAIRAIVDALAQDSLTAFANSIEVSDPIDLSYVTLTQIDTNH